MQALLGQIGFRDICVKNDANWMESVKYAIPGLSIDTAKIYGEMKEQVGAGIVPI